MMARFPWYSRQALDQHRIAKFVGPIDAILHRDITELADIPVGTVMSRLARARERLQQLLNVSVKEPLT